MGSLCMNQAGARPADMMKMSILISRNQILYEHDAIRSSMHANPFSRVKKMASFGATLKQSGDKMNRLKVKTVISEVEKAIAPAQPQHWEVCYGLLDKVFSRHGLVPTPLHLVPNRLQKPVTILILVLQALDIYEDEKSILADSKIQFLKAFHRYIYNPDFKIPSGTEDLKDLANQFHHVQAAFLDLHKSHQEVIEETAKGVGAGLAKFINKEIETVEDYNEYNRYAGVLPLDGFSKLVHVSGLDDLAPDNLITSLGLLVQKADNIRDYWDDINDTPKPRKLWPGQIWSKYVTNLEDMKYEENSVQALKCLNEMVSDALTHVQDCLMYLSVVRDPYAFRAFAIYMVNAIRILALCYNNIEVFNGSVNFTPGVTLRIAGQTQTMPDVYAAFFKYSSMIKSKIEKHVPDATETLRMLEAILGICKDSGIPLWVPPIQPPTLSEALTSWSQLQALEQEPLKASATIVTV